jgi:hypothetical protein
LVGLETLRKWKEKCLGHFLPIFSTSDTLNVRCLGVSRKELSHSKFLSWLFNPREDHKLEEFALKKLLELITIDLNGKNQDIKSIEKYILTDSYELSNILIEIEKAINKDSRLDILIQGEIIIEKKLRNFKIIIENKVTSLESKDQTQRYFDFFERDRKENDILIYLYLTSISTLELIELSEPECKCKEFIQINYQSIVDLTASIHCGGELCSEAVHRPCSKPA